jgi:hypothetical protein
MGARRVGHTSSEEHISKEAVGRVSACETWVTTLRNRSMCILTQALRLEYTFGNPAMVSYGCRFIGLDDDRRLPVPEPQNTLYPLCNECVPLPILPMAISLRAVGGGRRVADQLSRPTRPRLAPVRDASAVCGHETQ